MTNIKVCLKRNYDCPDLKRQTPGNHMFWKNIEFLEKDMDYCDYLVVLNKPDQDIQMKCPKGNKFLIIQEPPYQRNSRLIKYFRFFDKVYCQFDKKYSKKIIHSHTALPWHINLNYDELVSLKTNDLLKEKEISWVTSNKNFHTGHKKRLDFLNYLKLINFNFDLYGNGFKWLENKEDGLMKYKYTFAIENYSDDYYWTEKIADAYLSWCMPIYYGCKKIINYFPEESMILIDIENPQEAVKIIKQAISDKKWERNIKAIEHSRNLILEKYQFFPFIVDKIKEDKKNSIKKTKSFIPASGYRKYESFLIKIIPKLKFILPKSF